MSLPLPTSLSPSKVSTFKDCALAFRFSAIDKLPEPPSIPATKGTLVHRALELLFVARPHERTRPFADGCFADAVAELDSDPEFLELGLTEADAELFVADAARMFGRYFDLEDPTSFDPIGVELLLSTHIDNLLVRGIIDRLDRLPNGDLVVTDYKTGRAPSANQEAARLGGVHFYAYLCQRIFGVRPAKVQLMYLGSSPQIIVATPTEQSIAGLERKLRAVWSAIELACEQEDFRPKQSMLCNWCSFKEFCPAFGGNPEAARSAAA